MVVNQKNSLPFDRINKSGEIPISSEPKIKIKPRDNDQSNKKFLFYLFCFSNLFISLNFLHLDFKKNAPPQSYDVPDSCPAKGAHEIYEKFKNLYDVNFLFDFYAFLGPENIDRQSQLIWSKQDLAYGDLSSTFSFSTNVPVSQVGSGHRWLMDRLKIN